MSSSILTNLFGINAAFVLYLAYCRVAPKEILSLTIKALIVTGVIAAATLALLSGSFTQVVDDLNIAIAPVYPVVLVLIFVTFARQESIPRATPFELVVLNVVAPLIAGEGYTAWLLNPIAEFLPEEGMVRKLTSWFVILWPTWFLLGMVVQGVERFPRRKLLLVLWMHVIYLLLLLAPFQNRESTLSTTPEIGFVWTLLNGFAAFQIILTTLNLATIWSQAKKLRTGEIDVAAYVSWKLDTHGTSVFTIMVALCSGVLLVLGLKQSTLSQALISVILLLAPMVIGRFYQLLVGSEPSSSALDELKSRTQAAFTKGRLAVLWGIGLVLMSFAIVRITELVRERNAQLHPGPPIESHAMGKGRLYTARMGGNLALFYEEASYASEKQLRPLCSNSPAAQWVGFQILDKETVECKWRTRSIESKYSAVLYGRCPVGRSDCTPSATPQ